MCEYSHLKYNWYKKKRDKERSCFADPSTNVYNVLRRNYVPYPLLFYRVHDFAFFMHAIFLQYESFLRSFLSLIDLIYMCLYSPC